MGYNICRSYIDKGLESKIYKKLIKLNSQKTIQFKNGQKILMDFIPKKTYRFQTGGAKDAQYY